MSNYITIESGYFEPFKENETDPELKIWADKYFGIIGKVHDALLENEKRYGKRYAHLKDLSNRIVSLSTKKDKMFNEKHRQYNFDLEQIHHQLHQIDLKYKEDENRYYKEGWGFPAVSNFIDELKANNGDDIVEKRLRAKESSLSEEVEKQTREQLLHTSFKDEMDAVFDDSEIGFFMEPHCFFEKENEQDRSVWRYNHIKGLLHSEEYIDEHIKKQDSTFFSCLSELKEELRECLLHRTWIGLQSVLINDSNIVNVELANVETDRQRYDYCLILRTGVWTTIAQEFDYYQRYREENDFIDQVKKELEEYLGDNQFFEEFSEIFSRCSIVETYKDFQSNSIEKIKKEKIKCRRFDTRNEIDGISVRT